MFKLDYQLTVHCPFRPFEGHLIEMKTHGNLGFDLEGIREHSDAFFKVSERYSLIIALIGMEYYLKKLEQCLRSLLYVLLTGNESYY